MEITTKTIESGLRIVLEDGERIGTATRSRKHRTWRVRLDETDSVLSTRHFRNIPATVEKIKRWDAETKAKDKVIERKEFNLVIPANIFDALVVVIDEFGNDWREKLSSIWARGAEHKHYEDETACALRQARNRYFKDIMGGSMGLIREKGENLSTIIETINKIAKRLEANVRVIPVRNNDYDCATIIDGELSEITNARALYKRVMNRVSDCGGNWDELELGDTTEEDLLNVIDR